MKIRCACGCNEEFEGKDKQGRLRKFVQGHNTRGRFTPVISKCLFCNKEFRIHPSDPKYGKGKYCKRKCESLDKEGKMPKNTKGLEIGRGWNKGKQLSIEHRNKLSVSHIGKKGWNKGLNYKLDLDPAVRKKHSHDMKKMWQNGVLGKEEKNHRWMGSRVGYGGLHSWIKKKLGTPNTCEHCNGLFYGRNIHWANKSGMYLRDITDWLRLCAKCHSRYDKGKENARIHFRKDRNYFKERLTF